MKFILPLLDVAPIAPPQIITQEIVEESAGMPAGLIIGLIVACIAIIGLTMLFVVKNKVKNEKGDDE